MKKVIRFYRQGLKICEIAKECNMTRWDVVHILYDEGLIQMPLVKKLTEQGELYVRQR